MTTIVDSVREDWKEMQGKDDLHKWISAYLTDTFIQCHGVPNDECLEEAEKIINVVQNWPDVDVNDWE
jgi:hypothetical protein